MLDQIFSYREMCEKENVQTLQRGMNFRLNPKYSVILMSRRSNAPYRDSILDDGVTIKYEGHDEPRLRSGLDPKTLDQRRLLPKGGFTQNGYFIQSIEAYHAGKQSPELVKVYEKVLSGVWSLKGFFDLIGYSIEHDGHRNVFIFLLKLSREQGVKECPIDLKHTRLIPSQIKKEVWKRDGGKCVICGLNKNLHFDHDLPFSRGGTSLTAKNIKLLCAKCNLMKSDKIE